eukprot:m.489569 g.489569  ORF g.489569 m.489569 type:complete len:80 (-) comp26890_c0_seq1:211-450(-)
MSQRSKMTFAASCAATAGIIYAVHWTQAEDRRVLRETVLADMESTKRKKQNMDDLKQQQLLRQHLESLPENQTSPASPS